MLHVLYLLLVVVACAATYYMTSGYEYIQRNVGTTDFVLYNKRQVVAAYVFKAVMHLSAIENIVRYSKFDSDHQIAYILSINEALERYYEIKRCQKIMPEGIDYKVGGFFKIH